MLRENKYDNLRPVQASRICRNGSALVINNDGLMLMSNHAFRWNQVVSMTPKHFRVTQVLALNMGRAVTYNDMLDWLYVYHDMEEPECAQQGLSVALYYIRDQLKSIGVIVDNWHSVGFRMLLQDR